MSPAVSPEPPIGGTCAPGFEVVADAFGANWRDHGELGAAVHVIVDGHVVVDLWGGWADAERSVPWSSATLVNAYSTGKPFVALTLLRLVDAGVVELDTPVAQYWPAFAAEGKQGVTVRQALCHRAGVPAIREPLVDADLADFDRMAAALAATEPFWRDAERHCYHSNTYGHLIGGIVRAVTGAQPRDALQAIAEPLDADLHVGVAAADLSRCADVIWEGATPPSDHRDLERLDGDAFMTMLSYVNPPGYSSVGIVNTELWRRAQVPSTNMHATARGVARLYEGVRTGRVVSPALLTEATRAQSVGWCPALERDVSFGFGFQPWTPARPIGRSPEAYGHFGTGGSLGYTDPVRGISFGYVMNHVRPRWRSPRNQGLLDALHNAVDARATREEA